MRHVLISQNDTAALALLDRALFARVLGPREESAIRRALAALEGSRYEAMAHGWVRRRRAQDARRAVVA